MVFVERHIDFGTRGEIELGEIIGGDGYSFAVPNSKNLSMHRLPPAVL